MLIKTTTILKRAYSDLEFGDQIFRHDSEPEYFRNYEFVIPIDIWEELGNPEFITVSIEPGDTLNIEDEDASY